MALTKYNTKRNFKETSEPQGKADKQSGFRFVVQRHHASHLHYDFRLELGGVLKSWAVPKGPSLNPKDKRLAMMVEDHPVSYIKFAGDIPEGNYGAGHVTLWDKGKFVPVNKDHEALTEKQALSAIHKGELKFSLKGKKLKGEFVLVHLKNDSKNDNSWLLIKHKDDYATTSYNAEDLVSAAVKKAGEKKKQKDIAPEKSLVPKRSTSLRSPSAKKYTQFYKPMLATLVDKPFDDADWIFEIKWDGYRAIADCQDNTIKLYSRNGLSFSDKFPQIAEALTALPHEAVLDGEIVLMDKNNKPSFQKLQHYEDNKELPLLYYVFDLLFLDKKDIRHLPLLERKELLKNLLEKNNNDLIRYCDHIDKNGIAFFESAKKADLEGIIAKKSDSQYTCNTRSKEWLKIKNINSREGIIVGYTKPRNSRKYFGALVLAQYANNELIYMGHTGTGFDEKTLRDLWEKMQPLITKTSPFKEKVKVNMPVTWIKPKLVCELNYTEMTEDGLMRHPVFLGLRIDKSKKEVIKTTEMPTPVKKINKNIVEKKKLNSSAAVEEGDDDKKVKVNNHVLSLTNLNKVYWPKEKFTKGDLIDYYEKISPYILPYLKGRPLSLKRNPNGILDDGFFQKDFGAQAPAWIPKAEVESDSNKKTIEYIMCENKAALMYIANLGCIEINPWNSLYKKMDFPTYMIIDIDPSDKNSFDEVIETALATKDVLDAAGADCYCKTSGATGLHVYVPMGGKYDYEQVKNFAHLVAHLISLRVPKFTSLERSLTKRGKKIYVDFLQNRRGQTLASAYSVRPKPGATVSTPLEWKEVKKGLHPSQFTIKNIFDRLEKKGDLFTPVLKKGIDLKKCLAKLEAV
ncbi:MAG: DNA ligase D [Chitinophagaceae bacterium]